MPPITAAGRPRSNPASIPGVNSPPSSPVSGAIAVGASIGAATGAFAITGTGRCAALVMTAFADFGAGSTTAGGGGGGGGRGAAMKTVIASRGSGSVPIAYNVDNTNASITATWPTA